MKTIHWIASPPPASATIAAVTAATEIGPRKKLSVKISPTASAPAAIIHQTHSSIGDDPTVGGGGSHDPPGRRRLAPPAARRVERPLAGALSTSASRSAVSSQPAESRMNPSDTSSPPQRARRSAVVWTLPKLVASVTSSAAARKRSALSALSRSKETTIP